MSSVPPRGSGCEKTIPFRKRTCAPADDTTQLFVDGPFPPGDFFAQRGAQVRFLNGLFFTASVAGGWVGLSQKMWY